ncbi:MAG: DUF3084 domain-containing protein [Candidatus Eremiobacteraeota bacterium]|nr:DUF3084 domain-containing protein [Candidatus Eremiobacteraeota bacterium]
MTAVVLAFDIRPVITVAAIVVLAGLIAFVGDRVGHQVGRRRMTLFGLRPRYTSTIFAVGFGMIIALFAVAFVALVNIEARQALFSINTLRDEIKTLTAQRDQLLLFVREAPLVFRNGEPISRPVIIDTNDDVATIENNLTALFRVVAEHYSHIPDVQPYPQELTPAAHAKIAALARQIKTFAPDDAIVVPVAGENIFRHGAMSISFDVFRDSMIYRKGEIIAAVPVTDGSNLQASSAALEQLRIAITDNAVSHGMPPTIADSPEASVDAFDNAYRQLTHIHGAAVMRAIAAADIKASGPLTTELRVAPAR